MKSTHFKLFFLVIFISISCEDIYDKERKYEQDLNSKFERNLPAKVKTVLLGLYKNDNKFKNRLFGETLSLNGKICAVQGDYDLNNKETIVIDHLLTKELIKNGHQITFDLQQLDYLIFTDTDLEDVGYYEDSDGKKTDTASIPHDFIYVYNLRNNKLSFVTVNKGGNPEKTITQSQNRLEAPFGKIWYAEDYVNFLEKHKYLSTKGKEKLKRFHSEDYVQYLEENDFLGLSE